MSLALVLMASISIYKIGNKNSSTIAFPKAIQHSVDLLSLYIDEEHQACMPTLYGFAWKYVIVHAAIYAFIMAIFCCWIFSHDFASPWWNPNTPTPRRPIRPRPRYQAAAT
jgi:hypothetical protein